MGLTCEWDPFAQENTSIGSLAPKLAPQSNFEVNARCLPPICNAFTDDFETS